MSVPISNGFLMPVPTLIVEQNATNFYIFSISAKQLLSVAYTSERTQYNRQGIQRGLRRDRLREIGKYLNTTTPGIPILPNAIIVSLSTSSFYKDGLLYINDVPSGEAFVIDGQHRLWAFQHEFSGATDLSVVVVAFIDLSDSDKAFIFRAINGNQRKIDPSLVYDLIPMLRDTEPIPFQDKRCQDLVASLNEDVKSPWKDKISMVGGGDRIISQASFISAIKKLFKKGAIFANDDPDFFEERLQYDLLNVFFSSVANMYSAEWDNKSYLLCKYVGVASLLNLLGEIIKVLRQAQKPLTDNNGILIEDVDLNPFISALRVFSFDASEEKRSGRSYVGEGGVAALTQRIIKFVFSN